MTDPTPQTTPTRDEAVPTGWKFVPVDPTDAMVAVGRTYGTNSANTYRAMLASAPAPASGGVVVKALEWKEPEPNWWEAYSQTLRLGYEVSLRRDGTVRTRSNGDEKFQTFNGTIDEAKAAAQADYEQRIRSALSPAATPVSEAGRKETHQLDGGLSCEFDGDCYMLTWPDGHWLTAKADGSVIVGRSPSSEWHQPACKSSVAALAKPASSPAGGDDDIPTPIRIEDNLDIAMNEFWNAPGGTQGGVRAVLEWVNAVYFPKEGFVRVEHEHAGGAEP